jgi:hypothetical protein
MPVMPSTLFSPPRTSRSRKKPIRSLGGDYMFISSGRIIYQDDELFLQYGAHSNSRLFVEYGFVNPWAPGDCLRGDFVGEVDLQVILEEMFQKRGTSICAWMRRVLEDEGYWGYIYSLCCIYLCLGANIFCFITGLFLQRLDNAFFTHAGASVIPTHCRTSIIPYPSHIRDAAPG